MIDALASHVHLFRPGTKARTLLMLHGTGGDEASFARLAGQLDPKAAVLSVRGSVQENGLNRFFRRVSEGVYDMADLALRTRELIAFVEAAVERYGLDPKGLVGVGYSNGANILASMLFHDAGVAPSAVLMHPLIPFAPPDNLRLAANRVLITAGRRDPICPPPLTEALAGHLRRMGATTELFWHAGGHELRPEELDAAQRLVGQGNPQEAPG
jgi:phospholipase/carboxylesterase